MTLSPAANTGRYFKTGCATAKIAIFDDAAVVDATGNSANGKIVIAAGDGNIRGAPAVFNQALVYNACNSAGTPVILAAGCCESAAL